jgi:hypothetical protein
MNNESMETPIYSEKQAMQFRWPIAVLGVAIMLFGASQIWQKEPRRCRWSSSRRYSYWYCGGLRFCRRYTTELRFGFHICKRFAGRRNWNVERSD